MSEWKQKRFWKNVHVVSSETGYFIKLDDKILKTPAKKQMMLPTEALAIKVASEWDDQDDQSTQHGDIGDDSIPTPLTGKCC